jgi:hypothetical protein
MEGGRPRSNCGQLRRLTGQKADRAGKDELVEECLPEQAVRVSHQCAFFLAELGTPGYIIERGPTDAMFDSPQDPRTSDYVQGRFG